MTDLPEISGDGFEPADEVAMTPAAMEVRARMAHNWAASVAPNGLLPWTVRQHFTEDMPKVIETLVRLAQEKDGLLNLSTELIFLLEKLRDRAKALEQAQPLLADGSEVESLEPVESPKTCGKSTLRGMPCVLPADHSEPNIHHAEGQERSKRDVTFRPGWLQKRVAKSVESLNRLPADLRASLEQPTAAHRRRRAEGQERSEEPVDG